MSQIEVGVDIGGTKTHLRTRGASGQERDLILPTTKWRARDWDKDAIAVLALARKLAAGAEPGAITVGAHGCDDASECEAFQAALAEHATCPVVVVNDAELLPAALGYENQIGLVAGTGSIAVCREHEHGMMVAGGWGWVIGDEGSATGLVREAARAVSLHLDGGGALSEPLVALLLEGLAIPNAARLGSVIATLGGSAELGRHAALVFAAEASGSLLARQVIREGAKRLVELVAHLRKRGSAATIVVAGGGVIVAQSSLANAFLEEFENRFEGAMKAEIYAGAPVEGACRLAATLRRQATKGQPCAIAR